MGLLSIEKFKQMADSVAKQHEILENAVGDADTNNTVVYGIDQNLQRIMGLNDYDPMNALLKNAGEAKILAHPLNLARSYNSELVKGLDKHLAGLDDWLSDNDVRVHPLTREVVESCGINISSANVFPPAINTSIGLGRLSRGTPDIFTDGEAINANLYGKANLYAEITAVGGSSVSWTVSVACKKINGDIEGKQVTFSSAALNAVSDIGLHDTDMYVDVVDISTVSGGNAGDELSVYSEEERNLSL